MRACLVAQRSAHPPTCSVSAPTVGAACCARTDAPTTRSASGEIDVLALRFFRGHAGADCVNLQGTGASVAAGGGSSAGRGALPLKRAWPGRDRRK
eukprot:3633637-Pleurochrysis_carterae.AAC.1